MNPQVHVDRLIHVLLREELGGQRVPDLTARILAAAGRQHRRRWWQPLAAAAGFLVVLGLALFLTLGRRYPLPTVDGAPRARGAAIQAGPAGARVDLGGYCRVRLAGGTHVVLEGQPHAEQVRLLTGQVSCDITPGRGQFTVVTPLGAAAVVGTQFEVELVKGDAPGRFAGMLVKVLAGTVLVTAGDRRVTVGAGERHLVAAAPAGLAPMAGTAAPGGLSAADAWIRELLARAAAGPPAALDFGACSTRDRRANWVCEQRAGGGWRFWNQESVTAVYFDRARHTRGVFMARVMMFPKDGVAPELAPPATAARVPFAGHDEPAGLDAGWRGVYLSFVKGERTTPEALPYGTERALALTRSRERPGIWYRCVAYFDTAVAGGGLAVLACWPADAPVPPAAEWLREGEIVAAGGPVCLGLLAHGGPAVIEGLGFAPLGPDFPPLPAGLGRPTRPLSQRGKP